MPTNLPPRDILRPLPVHATREDRLTVAAILLACAVLTLALATRLPQDALFIADAQMC